MPNISFASGGDSEMSDFVAYVAKDDENSRCCHILDCKGGIAQEVITTIGQAFELRFKEFLKKGNRPIPNNKPDYVEYYNDLPGKKPPSDQNLIDLSTDFSPEYINGYVKNDESVNDPFEMGPFNQKNVQEESWFHGAINRTEAENLMKNVR